MLVERIENYLTGSDQELNKELVSQMWDAFSYATKRQFMEKRELSRTLRGSNPGPCARKMAYAYLGYQSAKDVEARTKITWWTGDILELCLVGLVKLSGVELEDTCLEPEGQAEGLFEATPGLYIPCHADGIIPVQPGVTKERLLLEIKSTSDFGFKRQWKRGEISTGYQLQHQIYLEAFNLEKGIFLVVNKNTGHIHEVFTEKDPDLIAWGRKNYTLAAGSDPENLPPRFVDGQNYGRLNSDPTKLAWGCTYCDFSHHCWKGLQVDLSGYKPVYRVPAEEDAVEEVGMLGISKNSEFELNLGI